MKRRACPTPWKRAYTNRKDAGKHLRQLRRRYGSIAKGERTYRCACGRWHVGGGLRQRKGRAA